ncbi:hypothetical protein OsccyDRAFT_0083 [Leptolyngbyaceae cyanobacterium JSC-12]|nr:hypothetical protein OsccyDRAFT_0083 [Leptolyngbyaceae cyanobacterium JSC-12]
MLKYYLQRTGQIPTSIHPFIKQPVLAQPQPLSLSQLLIQRWYRLCARLRSPLNPPYQNQ